MKSQRPPTLVKIQRFSEEGLGSGEDEAGRTWVARAAVPGSAVWLGGKREAAVVLKVETPAPDEISAPCPAFGLCGGCQWQTFPLERQREEKLGALRRLLAPLGAEDGGITGPPDGYGWRSKMEFSFGRLRYLSAEEQAAGADRHGRFLGLHAAKFFDRIVDLEQCPLMSPGMNQVYAAMRKDLLASPWDLYEPREHTGFWRYLVLREGHTGRVATLHSTSATPEVEAWLEERNPGWRTAGITGLRWLVGDAHADAVGGRVQRQWGDVEIGERLGGRYFQLTADAFFQVNKAGAEALVEVIRQAAGTGEVLLDLYCGTGALGLALSDQFRRVIGVELFEPSVQAARENAERNGVKAEYHCGPVEKVVGGLELPEEPVVIVDPPRAGLHKDAVAFLGGLKAKRLVYVACKASSLLRDALMLRAHGWVLKTWQAIDMFPQTSHVEVVALFERITPS